MLRTQDLFIVPNALMYIHLFLFIRTLKSYLYARFWYMSDSFCLVRVAGLVCIYFEQFVFLSLADCTNLRADIVVLLDASPTNIRFVTKMVEALPIGDDRVRIAAISYSEDVRLEFKLNQFNTSADVLQALTEIDKRSRPLQTGDALYLARDLAFRPGNGNRPDVPDVIVLLSSRRLSDLAATRLAVKDIKSQDYIVFAIGTSFFDSSGVFRLSSDYSYDAYRETSGTLDEISDMMVSSLCQGKLIISLMVKSSTNED